MYCKYKKRNASSVNVLLGNLLIYVLTLSLLINMEAFLTTLECYVGFFQCVQLLLCFFVCLF